jgi:hypothetical protein
MEILNEHEVLDLTYINPYGERAALLFAWGRAERDAPPNLRGEGFSAAADTLPYAVP